MYVQTIFNKDECKNSDYEYESHKNNCKDSDHKCESHKNNYKDSDHKCKCQSHVHEYLGSTRIAEAKEDPHNHRFAGVTGEAIPRGDSHVHQLLENTDFYENHHHEVGATTSPAISVGGGRHVHFVYGKTTCDDGHVHEFIFATLIENPIG